MPEISGTAEQVNFFIPTRPDPQSNSLLNSLVWRVSLLEKCQGERVNYIRVWNDGKESACLIWEGRLFPGNRRIICV